MVAPEFLRAAVSVFVFVFVIIAPGFLRAAVSVSEIVAGRLRAAVSVSEIIAGRLGAAVSVSKIVANRLRAAVSVSKIVANRLGAAVSVSKIVAGRLGAAVCVSVSVLVIIAPGFLRAAVSVFETIISANVRLSVGIDSTFENCSDWHFSGLGGEGRSLLRRVYSPSVGTGLALKAGRGRL